MINVFKVALAQWLFYRWIWWNSPESLQAYDPHLGANAKSFFAHIIEDPAHHILNELALGGYQLLLSTIQGTQVKTIILKGPLLSW